MCDAQFIMSKLLCGHKTIPLKLPFSYVAIFAKGKENQQATEMMSECPELSPDLAGPLLWIAGIPCSVCSRVFERMELFSYNIKRKAYLPNMIDTEINLCPDPSASLPCCSSRVSSRALHRAGLIDSLLLSMLKA